MKVRGQVGGLALALLMALGLVVGGTASASASREAPRTHLTALQTATRFLVIANTWKASWCNDSPPPSIGKRDVAYSSATLDAILKKVGITPEMDVCTVSFTPKTGRQLSRRSLPEDAVAIAVKTPVVTTSSGEPSSTFHVTDHVHVKMIRGDWKVVGAHLPLATGPAKYCDDRVSAEDECNIFPPGSN